MIPVEVGTGSSSSSEQTPSYTSSEMSGPDFSLLSPDVDSIPFLLFVRSQVSNET